MRAVIGRRKPRDASRAFAKYLDRKHDLQAGRRPRAKTGEATSRELLNPLHDAKKLRLDDLDRFQPLRVVSTPV
jgi:hypothetical protein